MRALSSYRYEMYNGGDERQLFMGRFADRLRNERGRQPRLPGVVSTLAALSPFFAVGQIAYLRQRDVIFQEAIKSVDRNAAEAKREADRRLHLPDIFSRREMRTGEADEEIGPAVAGE